MVGSVCSQCNSVFALDFWEKEWMKWRRGRNELEGEGGGEREEKKKENEVEGEGERVEEKEEMGVIIWR